MAATQLLEGDLALGQLLVDETQLIVLEQDLEAKLVLDGILGAVQLDSGGEAGLALQAFLLVIG